MSFIDCINGKAKEGLISKQKAKELQNKFEALQKKYVDSGQELGAATKAAEDIINHEATVLAQRKRNKIQQALKQKEINDLLNSMDGPIEKKVSDLYQRAAYRGEGVRASAYKFMNDISEKIAPSFFKVQKDYSSFKAGIRSAIDGIDDGADAGKVGNVIRDTFDYLHARYRAAGGIVGKIENYVPQIHAKEAIRKVSKEEWIDFTISKLDRERMIDPSTNLPFNDEKLLQALDHTYDRIVTNGKVDLQKLSKKGEAPVGISKDLDSSRETSRFLHFKNADAYFEYNDRFGVGDRGLVNAFLGHIDKMSRDIGVLESLGPKPNSMQKFLDFKMKAEGSSPVKRTWTNAEYKVLRGFGGGDGSGLAWKMLTASQNWLRSAMLGSASLSAISDTAFIAATAKINGLSGTRALGNYVKLMAGSKGLKEIGERSGFVVDVINGSVLADARFAGEIQASGFTGWLAGLTNKMSGLARMTKATQDGIALEGMATIAENLKTPWRALNEDLRDNLSRFGISESDWAIMQKHGVQDTGKGAKFYNTDDLRVNSSIDAKAAADIANKVDDWIFNLRQLAANEGSLATKALTTGAAFGDGTTGSMSRALASSLFMFKTFPVTVIMSHTLPAIKRAKVHGKFDHLAMVTVTTTIMGAGAMQLKEISKGKTARDMDSPQFWSAAFLQGGGLGIVGDFFLGDFSRFGRSPITQITGPLGGTIDDVFRATKGNFDRILDNKEPNFKRDMFRVLKRNIPLGSLWYGRLAMERLLLDNLERLADPNFDRRMRKYERKMTKNSGQQFWWKAGEDPDLNKIAGGK